MTTRYIESVITLALDEGRCTGCRRCTEVCPHGVFAMEDHRARIVDRGRCMECGACTLNCAWDAITVESGVGCVSALLTASIRNRFGLAGRRSSGSGGCC